MVLLLIFQVSLADIYKKLKNRRKKQDPFCRGCVIYHLFYKKFTIPNISMSPLHDLNNALLWRYFEDISRIPRLSRNEGQIIDYLLAFAQEQKLQAKKDNTGNVLISKPASPGMENRKTVILQSHMDMVGEKEQDNPHNFRMDPIIPIIDGDWVRASGTTLGADDGIGMAAQMVILSDRDLNLGPIECLFTVDEESGMTGAQNLEPGFMSGEILLNLDSEDEGQLFIGCAGGIDTFGTFKLKTKEPDEESLAYKMSVSGLKGGHSGDEIHKSPGNAIKILNRFLRNASNDFQLALSIFDGGNLRNAIPREAFAIFTIPAASVEDFEEYYQKFIDALKQELRVFEPELSFQLSRSELPDTILTRKRQFRLLLALYACPHGVVTWSPTLKGLVETSTNLASIKFPKPNRAIVTTSQRSSVDSAKKNIADRVASCFVLGGAIVDHSDGYPGWAPNPDSEILNITSGIYARLFGQEPLVRDIHAGLECGLILKKYPGLDMLSFGPTIKGAHTPSERINIHSTEKFWKLLLEVLGSIPERK
jgi:dipeptidase D